MFTRTRTAFFALFLLTACANSESLENLKTVAPKGDTFQVALANDYKDYAEELALANQWSLADYFARKGLYVAEGNNADPEDPTLWKFNEAQLKELGELRTQLMRAVETNRTTQPELTASAVLAFDRYVALLDVNAEDAKLAEQREVLAALLTKLEEAHVASETAPPPPPTIPAEANNRTVLYFPFDSDRLGDSALGALAALARTIPTTDETTIAINGHADRVGSEDYNMRLSERRAKFVLKKLEAAGISGKRMKHFAFGETDPAVETADGVEEPKNRRVEIIVE